MKRFSQRPAAVLTVVAFVLGTIAIPALHLVFHALPHDHAGGEIHYVSAAHGEHEHQHHAAHRHPERKTRAPETLGEPTSLFASLAGLNGPPSGASRDDGDPAEDREGQQPLDPRHGSGAAAHFSLAISDGVAAAFVLPLHAEVVAALVLAPVSVRTSAAHVSVQRFRGPPRG
ncbi:MAG TPA: hypothetical protein VF911_00385 [Thermoanaerobaculia bacterium]|jgi:hypothetical protein